MYFALASSRFGLSFVSTWVPLLRGKIFIALVASYTMQTSGSNCRADRTLHLGRASLSLDVTFQQPASFSPQFGLKSVEEVSLLGKAIDEVTCVV